MTRKVCNPCAIARVTWLRPENGGRATGPPPGPSFTATAIFSPGHTEITPTRINDGEHYSVLLEYVTWLAEFEVDAKVDFLARDLVAPSVREGATFFVMDGPHVLAKATITSVIAQAIDG